MTSTQTETEWNWWQDALAGKVAPIDVNEPATGYYRVRDRNSERFIPIAYWRDTKTQEQRCHRNGKDLDPQRAVETWPFAARHPVSKEDYDFRLANSRWPNEHPSIAGHNRPPINDDIASIMDRITDLGHEAEKLIAAGPAQSSDVCDQASDLSNMLAELESKANKLRAAEKAPFLESCRQIDNKWRALIDRAGDFKRRLKAIVVGPFLIKKHQEVENANVLATLAGGDPAALPEVRLVAGAVKRSTALRTFYRAEIEDRAKLLDSLKDHPEVIACIQAIADAAAKRKVALPGCRVVTEKRAA